MERAYQITSHPESQGLDQWGTRSVHYLDEATGAPCRFVCDEGQECWGYVGVSPHHPLYGLDLDECPMDCRGEEGGGCAHCPRARLAAPVQQTGYTGSYWWFGLPVDREWQAGTAQIHELAVQLAAIDQPAEE